MRNRQRTIRMRDDRQSAALELRGMAPDLPRLFAAMPDNAARPTLAASCHTPRTGHTFLPDHQKIAAPAADGAIRRNEPVLTAFCRGEG